MTRPTLHVPPQVHDTLREDLPDALRLLETSFDVVPWSDATPSKAKTTASFAEEAMKGMEVSTAIDCPFMPFVLDGEVPEALVNAAPTYPSRLHMISATAFGEIEEYFPGGQPQLEKALSLLDELGTPSALTVDGGAMGEVRMTYARGKDGASSGLFTILLE